MNCLKITLINLQDRTERIICAAADEAESSENIVIRAEVDGQWIESANYNYLPAFQDFRDKLLALGYGIKCNGARLCAVQSGMMGATDKVYLVKLGEPARLKDIVPIWDYAELNTFPNTAQQNEFTTQWLDGLKQQQELDEQ